MLAAEGEGVPKRCPNCNYVVPNDPITCAACGTIYTEFEQRAESQQLIELPSAKQSTSRVAGLRARYGLRLRRGSGYVLRGVRLLSEKSRLAIAVIRRRVKMRRGKNGYERPEQRSS